MVIGGIMLTGLGGKFTSLVFAATGGQSGLCLSMVALVCIILGMGMPVPAAYVLTATLAAPALLEFKFSLMSAHLFIVYFSAYFRHYASRSRGSLRRRRHFGG